jgi:hypothetical protein
VVECFELHAGGLKFDPPGCLPLLHASLNVSTRSDAIINANNFTLGTISKMWGSAGGSPQDFSLEKKMNASENTQIHL